MSSTFERVQEIIADSLYVEKEECKREANLMKDLGAESIDFLDIIFRLEQEFNIKLPKGEMERKARGSLTEEQFAVEGVIQDAGLESLRAAMPGVDPALIKSGLMVRDIPTLFTVASFEAMVNDQLNTSQKPVSEIIPLKAKKPKTGQVSAMRDDQPQPVSNLR